MTTLAIRPRLLTVVLLGVATSALSLVALYLALSSMSRDLRVKRAHNEINDELKQLARGPRSPQALSDAPGYNGYVGMRAGWAATADEAAQSPNLPAEWRAPVEAAVRDAAEHGHGDPGDVHVGEAVLVIAATRAAHGGFVWCGYSVVPAGSLRPFRWVAVGLSLFAAIFVMLAVWGLVSLRRSTGALHRTLVTLGKDLSAPVPPPKLVELAGIADGIRRMASDLMTSREATDRLGRELAQKERLAALGRVAAGVAHEVRNPLASIKLRLDLSAASGELPDGARRAVEAASQEIARLDRLVSDLLLVAGKKMGPRRVAELADLARARVEALAPWAATRRVALAVDGAGSADVDAESLARALDNLLRNAIEASPEDGRVAVSVLAADGAVELRVEDRGRGVEPAREGELFEPFFTTKAEGSGLGLAISRAIARAHGGDLRYSREGEVTRFAISLPRAPHESDSAGVARKPARGEEAA